MKTKSFILILMVFMVLLSVACTLTVNPQNNFVNGSGKIASEDRDVSGFSSVRVDGIGEVTVTIGDTESVVVETDDNLLPIIETKVSGKTLVIKTQQGSDVHPTKDVKITITMKSFDGAEINGSGNINVSGVTRGDINLSIGGSGNITVKGTADTVQSTLKGSGNIISDGLQTRQATVRLSGSGNITVFASERLDAVVSGSGTVKYAGNPAKVEQSVPGSGSISPM
jgi:hypothetical protein